MEQASVVRASLVVAAAALLEAILGPYLTFGWISPKLMVLGVVFSVAAYDLNYLTALNLAGLAAPPFGEYAVAGVIPDALLNALLAYFVGGWWLRIGRDKTGAWDER